MIQGNEKHAFKRWYNQLNRKEMKKMYLIHNKETMQRFSFPVSSNRDPMFDKPMFKPIDWNKFLGTLK